VSGDPLRERPLPPTPREVALQRIGARLVDDLDRALARAVAQQVRA
jgi:hypothetical protein